MKIIDMDRMEIVGVDEMKTKKLEGWGLARLILYVISALVGIASAVLINLEFTELAQLLATVAGAGATVAGGTAVANLPKAPDQHKTGGVDTNQVVPALLDIAGAARKYSAAMDYQGSHRATEDASPARPADTPAPRFSAYS